MPSVRVSEDQHSTFGSVFAVAALIAVVAAASVAVQILSFEEALATRTLVLVTIAACGAFATSLIVGLLGFWLTGSWNRVARSVLGAILVGGAFVPATLFSFAIENRLIEGHIEAESITDLTSVEVFWSMFGAMGMFTPPGLKYLMPWPLLAVTLAAAVCFYNWPRQGQRTGDKP